MFFPVSLCHRLVIPFDPAKLGIEEQTKRGTRRNRITRKASLVTSPQRVNPSNNNSGMANQDMGYGYDMYGSGGGGGGQSSAAFPVVWGGDNGYGGDDFGARPNAR